MKIRISKFLLFFILFSSCTPLLVENPNEPDLVKVFSTTEEFHDYAGSAFRTLHNGMQDYFGPASAMGVMADQNTCPWGFGAVKDLSSEPRRGWVNSVGYSYFYVTQIFWENCYDAISSSNDVLKVINDNDTKMSFEDSEINLLKAWSNFVSGVAHGYLGLTFDQANIVKGNSETDTLEFATWQTMIDVSLKLLDEAILIADNNSFTISAEWMGGEDYSNLELSALANSYAARILAYSSRNKLHNESINWNRVLQYTKNGIQKNLQPELGVSYDFYDDYTVYNRYPGWSRIDHRIINLMDPDYPSRWPNDGFSWTTSDGMDPGSAESLDTRLSSDFQYLHENNFQPSRGFYHFSHYRYKRYDTVFSNFWYGDAPKPTMLVWENEMLKAEALVRTGNIAGAVSILNDPNGARKLRGQLPDITSNSLSEILCAIFYEKDIELIVSGMGIGYFDMRRRDQLQSGTILHFPVPGKELHITMDENYTIDGSPDGENISEGSWTGLDGITSPLN